MLPTSSVFALANAVLAYTSGAMISVPQEVRWNTLMQEEADPEVAEILSAVGELGFMRTASMEVVLPQINVYTDQRIPLLLQFVSDYLAEHPGTALTCYFTVYDGWREHTPPATSDPPAFALLGPDEMRAKFVGHGSIGEPGRFINQRPDVDGDLYPVFRHPVMAFSRHRNDPSVLLVPDPEFIASRGYAQLKAEVDAADVPWEAKRARMVWRGGNNGVGYRVYNGWPSTAAAAGSNGTEEVREAVVDALGNAFTRLLNQRELVILSSQRSAFAHLIDAAFAQVGNGPRSRELDRAAMLASKYQLDVDGEVNAWSGLVWKLYSNSLVFKVTSHYEQVSGPGGTGGVLGRSLSPRCPPSVFLPRWPTCCLVVLPIARPLGALRAPPRRPQRPRRTPRLGTRPRPGGPRDCAARSGLCPRKSVLRRRGQARNRHGLPCPLPMTASVILRGKPC